MSDNKNERTIEALLFTSDRPLPASVIAEVLEMKESEVDEAVNRLNASLMERGSPVKVHRIAGGYEFLTLPEFAPFIKKLYRNRIMMRLSKPALEVLAIIAYKQPISKQEVELIRGVNSDGVYHTLLERKLIKIAGRKDSPGRPLLYGSTKEFLQYLGINSLDDLPKIEEIKAILDKDENIENWDARVEAAKGQAMFDFAEIEATVERGKLSERIGKIQSEVESLKSEVEDGEEKSEVEKLKSEVESEDEKDEDADIEDEEEDNDEEEDEEDEKEDEEDEKEDEEDGEDEEEDEDEEEEDEDDDEDNEEIDDEDKKDADNDK